MRQKTYIPQPIDTSDVRLPIELEELVEELLKTVRMKILLYCIY